MPPCRRHSCDGTPIAFDRTGSERALILEMARLPPSQGPSDPWLRSWPHHGLHYDRRGRGDSGNGPSYVIEREIEDLRPFSGKPAARRSSTAYRQAQHLRSKPAIAARPSPGRPHEAPFTSITRVHRSRRLRRTAESALAGWNRSRAVKLFMRLVGPGCIHRHDASVPGLGRRDRNLHTLPFDILLVRGPNADSRLAHAAGRRRCRRW